MFFKYYRQLIVVNVKIMLVTCTILVKYFCVIVVQFSEGPGRRDRRRRDLCELVGRYSGVKQALRLISAIYTRQAITGGRQPDRHISTALLVHLLEQHRCIWDTHFMLQEAAVQCMFSYAGRLNFLA